VGFANADGTTYFQGAVAVQRSASVLGSYPRLIEAGNVVECEGGAAVDGGGPAPPNLIQRVNIGKFQGVRNPMDDNTLKGTPSANPTTLVYFVIYVVGPITTSTGHIYTTATIEFDTLFTEPFQPVQS